MVKLRGQYLTRDGAWSTSQVRAQRFDDWVDEVEPDGEMATRFRAGTALYRAEWMAAKYAGARAVRLRPKAKVQDDRT